MKQREKEMGDKRKAGFCIYCNKMSDSFTKEHSPSKVFLDEPFPDNLPITNSCQMCNSSFSQDEEYLASILECIRCGTTNIDEIERVKIKKILSRNKKLHKEIIESFDLSSGKVSLNQDKLFNIGMKLARGHLFFEMNEIVMHRPTFFNFSTFNNMNDEEFENFESFIEADKTYEISKIFTEMLVLENIKNGEAVIFYPWQIVQDRQYRYMCAYNNNYLIVKIVISEYFTFEISWDLNEIKNLHDT